MSNRAKQTLETAQGADPASADDFDDIDENSNRKKRRVPLGQMRKKLAVEELPGFVMRWVNDVESRVFDAEEGGYAFVTYAELNGRPIGQRNTVPSSLEMGAKVQKAVGKDDQGAPIHAYLMKIKQEWYDEDQREKDRAVDATEDGVVNYNSVDDAIRRRMYGNVSVT